jgi:hypothetical protein
MGAITLLAREALTRRSRVRERKILYAAIPDGLQRKPVFVEPVRGLPLKRLDVFSIDLPC